MTKLSGPMVKAAAEIVIENKDTIIAERDETIRGLREALVFYADFENYLNLPPQWRSTVMSDGGAKARAAMKQAAVK